MNKLKPKELGQLFLEHYPVDDNGYSEIAYMEDLIKICPDFKTTNGCQWARSDNSWLGKQFEIDRQKKGRSIFSVQLIGFKKENKNHSIPNNIKNIISAKRCSILDIGTNIEVDHKNGKYNQEKYEIEDFQPLCKTANDAKRQHCKECQSENKRYDATRLGYKVPFIKGDFDSNFCEGCYWFDPIEFNRKISENY